MWKGNCPVCDQEVYPDLESLCCLVCNVTALLCGGVTDRGALSSLGADVIEINEQIAASLLSAVS